jgi:heat shock protein HtpX
MNQREYEEFVTGYYRHPTPSRAGEAIGYVATASWLADSTARRPAVYFFRRLVDLHPEVILQYRAMRAAVRDAGNGFVDEVLRSPAQSPLASPIRTPADIGLHWAEFWATGESEAVRRIIALLERPDRVRARLDAWIVRPSSRWGVVFRRRALERLGRFGIRCDSARGRVLMDEDLDCFVILNGLHPAEERLKLAEQSLPVPLSPDDRQSAWLKATAVATLAANAGRHLPVLAECRAQAQRASFSARRMLVRALVAAGAPLTEAERRALESETPHGPAGSEPDGPSVVRRALLAVALTLGFYTLALAVAAGLIAIAAAIAYYGRALGAKVAALFVGGGVVILWAILPRRDRFDPPGPRLSADTQPRLFAELAGIARAVGQPMPAEVYLDLDVNAWVAERGGVLGIGRRRVMGLGLPLLHGLTIAEFRAVLAHEFGHYHGGDTRLGPWVYKTRLAIVRTLIALEEHSRLVQPLFVWYGRLFVRLTHTVSRAQELAADRLAARTAGREALVGGLRAVHASSAAFGVFLSGELLPILRAGLRPSLSDGFRRFLAAPGVASQMAQVVDTQLVVGPASIYDTHPPLRERIAAVHGAPSADPVRDDRAAVCLLERVGELEIDMLVSMTGDAAVRTYPEVEWDRVIERVWIPTWRAGCREYATALAGLTPASLAENLAQPEALGQALAQDASIAADQARSLVVSIFGAGLALALHDHGWTIHGAVGTSVSAERGGLVVEPFSAVAALASRELSASAWRDRCVELGISSLALGESSATP